MFSALLGIVRGVWAMPDAIRLAVDDGLLLCDCSPRHPCVDCALFGDEDR